MFDFNANRLWELLERNAKALERMATAQEELIEMLRDKTDES